MTNLPSGTVTFLFTDIEGSTRLAQQYPGNWESMRSRHHEILRTAIEANNGVVFQIVGDEFCAAFHTAPEALRAALDAQRMLQDEDWQPAPIKVRMGISTGAARVGDVNDPLGGYTGYTTLARVQRVMSAGHGGQVLLSDTSASLTRGELPQGVSLRDLGEQRLKGLLNPEHIWQAEAPGLPHDFPPLNTLNAIPNNLPAQLTSFVGREKEIAEVKQELDAHRLVTLVGPGGTGKSRLSLQVAAHVLDAYPHGVWFIDLSPLSDPELVPQTILSTLGVGEQKGQTVLETLAEFLHDKTLLLLLDNCEHLIEACARLAQAVLKTSPNLRILATSRESLGVSGEVAWHVPSLTLPNPRDLPEANQLTQYESVQLFIDRVQLVSSHFAVNQDNAPAVAQICYRLDGIPLALELAAARARSMSVEQIMSRLDDRFRLLTGGSRTALPRQQTLRAMIDWSYDLLSEPERLLLRRLSVFAGGCTLEMAERVCADEKLDTLDILDLLGHLVDKSLLALESQSDESRYRILETIRQYAREKLFESGEGAVLRDRHCAALIDLVEMAEPELQRSTSKKWLRTLDAEQENVRSAIWWALENRDARRAARLCTAMDLYWNMRWLNREGAVFCREALTLVEKDEVLCNTPAYPLLLAETINNEIEISLNLLTAPATLAALQKAVSLLEQLGFPRKSFRAFWQLSQLYLVRNDFKRAEEVMERLLDGARQAGDEEGIAWALDSLGGICARMGDIPRQYALYTQSRDLFQKLGYHLHALDTADSLLEIEFCRGNVETARRQLQTSLRTAQEMEFDLKANNILLVLAMIAYLQGNYEQAKAYYQEAEARSRKSAEQIWENIFLQIEEGHFLYVIGDLENASRCYESALDGIHANQSGDFAGNTLKKYGLILLRQGRLEEARRCFEQSISQLERVGWGGNSELAWYGLGELERLAGNLPAATGHYQRALFLRNKFQIYVYTPQLFDAFAKLALQAGDLPASARWFGFAEALRTRFGIMVDPVDCPDNDKHMGLLKSRMSPEDLSAAWAHGAAISFDAAVALALDGYTP